MARLTFLICCFFSLNCFGQKDSTRSTDDDLHVYFGMGAFGQNFSNLSSRIATRPEYQSIRKTGANLSLGWFAQTDKVIVDFAFGFGSSFSGNADTRSTGMVNFNSSVKVGYNLSNNNAIRIYPFIGLGVDMYRVTFNKDVSAIPFDSVLQSTTWQQKTAPLSFTNTFIVYKAGLSVDFVSKKNNRISTGLRAGYTGSFGNRAWRINDNQLLSNAPKDNLSSWFVSIQFTRKVRKHGRR
jgi:hypothetical protein